MMILSKNRIKAGMKMIKLYRVLKRIQRHHKRKDLQHSQSLETKVQTYKLKLSRLSNQYHQKRGKSLISKAIMSLKCHQIQSLINNPHDLHHPNSRLHMNRSLIQSSRRGDSKIFLSNHFQMLSRRLTCGSLLQKDVLSKNQGE